MKITSEYNLGKLYPELAREWHPTRNRSLTPFQVTPRSNKRVWWKCKLGHEWKTSINHRSQGTGCPRCYQEKRGTILRQAILKKRKSQTSMWPR